MARRLNQGWQSKINGVTYHPNRVRRHMKASQITNKDPVLAHIRPLRGPANQWSACSVPFEDVTQACRNPYNCCAVTSSEDIVKECAERSRLTDDGTWNTQSNTCTSLCILSQRMQERLFNRTKFQQISPRKVFSEWNTDTFSVSFFFLHRYGWHISITALFKID